MPFTMKWKDGSEEYLNEYEYFKPERRKYPRLTQFSVARQEAYEALDPLLTENPDFMRDAAEIIFR